MKFNRRETLRIQRRRRRVHDFQGRVERRRMCVCGVKRLNDESIRTGSERWVGEAESVIPNSKRLYHLLLPGTDEHTYKTHSKAWTKEKRVVRVRSNDTRSGSKVGLVTKSREIKYGSGRR